MRINIIHLVLIILCMTAQAIANESFSGIGTIILKKEYIHGFELAGGLYVAGAYKSILDIAESTFTEINDYESLKMFRDYNFQFHISEEILKKKLSKVKMGRSTLLDVISRLNEELSAKMKVRSMGGKTIVDIF